MKFKRSEIFLHLRNDPGDPINPIKSKFATYCRRVEDYIISQCGFDRGNASESSLNDVEKVAKNFTTKVQAIYYKCYMKLDTILHTKYMEEEFEIEM